MENKKERTAPNVSVGADTEQPIQKIAENSISEYEENIKSFEEMQREMQLSLDPSYLKAVSMNELFDTQYQSKPPLIDGLLYPGTYIFAGSPKLGKSFLMAQLAYHVSTGTALEKGMVWSVYQPYTITNAKPTIISISFFPRGNCCRNP